MARDGWSKELMTGPQLIFNSIGFIRESALKIRQVLPSLGRFIFILFFCMSTSLGQIIGSPATTANPSNFDGLPSEAPTYIIIDDQKQMGELFKRLSKPDFQLLRPSSVTDNTTGTDNQIGFIRSLRIKGRVEGNTASLFLDYEIEQTKPGKVWTKIGLDGVGLQSVQSNGKDLIVSVLKDKSWSLQTESPGIHKVEVRIGVDVISDRSTKRIGLSIPESPSTQFELEVPETVLFATTSNRDQLALKYDETRKATLISSKLPPRSKIDVKWLGQSLLVRDDNQRIECRGLISLRLDPDAVSTMQLWQIIPMSGFIRELQFDYNPSIMVTDIQINGQAIKSVASKLPSGMIRTTIRIPDQLLLLQNEPLTCEIVTKELYSEATRNHVATAREITWSAPTWSNAAITSGVIALEYPEKWINLTDASEHLIPVDYRDLPDRLRKPNALSAFQFNDRLRNVEFKVRAKISPIHAKSHTIGIVRDDLVEYVTEIELFGEIVKTSDYHLQLGPNSQILFVGPRDLWERYDLMEDTDEKNFTRVKITPNKSAHSSGKSILRIRYAQKIDPVAGFGVVSPSLAESRSSENLTWLIPRPGFNITPVEVLNNSQHDITPDSMKTLVSLLDQSITDKDRWLNTSLIKNEIGWFQRSSGHTSVVMVKLKKTTPQLSYRLEMEIKPDPAQILIKYKYDCIIESGLLSSIRIRRNHPSKAGQIYRYKIDNKESNIDNQLIFKDNITEIMFDNPRQGKVQILIEELINLEPDLFHGALQNSDQDHKLNLEELSIVDGTCISRSVSAQSTLSSKITFPSKNSGWQNDISSEGYPIKMFSTDNNLPLPKLNCLFFRNPSDLARITSIEKIQSFYDSNQPDNFVIRYHFQAGTTELMFSKTIGLEPYSATTLNGEMGVLKTDSGFKIPVDGLPDQYVLTIKFRRDSNSNLFELPLPIQGISNKLIPTQLIYETNPFYLPFTFHSKDWSRIFLGPPMKDGSAGTDYRSKSAYVYESIQPGRPIRIYLVNIMIPFFMITLCTMILLFVLTISFDDRYLSQLSIALSSISLALYLNDNVNNWLCAGVIAGVFAGSIIKRFDRWRFIKKGKQTDPNQVPQSKASSIRQLKVKEPSTVLKLKSHSVPIENPRTQIVEQSWTVAVESNVSGSELKKANVNKDVK